MASKPIHQPTSEVVTTEPPGEVATYGGSILAVIERAARDPNVDIDKMERLLALQERVQERNSVIAFNGALAEMQPRLPIITERGKIIIPDKNDKTKNVQETPYALWEDINEAIRPLLHEFGFSLAFKTGTASDGKLLVTGILRHNLGHQEEASIPLPHDSSGSKNAVQAIGSSLSYGKRYAAMQLLNITTKGEDDDGAKATYKDSHGEPQPRTLLDGPHVSKSALKGAVQKLRLEVGACYEAKHLNAIMKAAAPTIEQAERDWTILVEGDPRIPEDRGLKGDVQARRQWLKDNGGMFTATLDAMRECDTKATLERWYGANESVIEALDDPERRYFDAQYEQHEAGIAALDQVRS